jgi:hypothetical protein
MGASMRLIPSCLLLSLLLVCQVAQASPAQVMAAARFPQGKWTTEPFSIEGFEGALFLCSKEQCGERVAVAIAQKTLPSVNGASPEDMLRMKNVDDAFIKQCVALLKSTVDPKNEFDIKVVRKINGKHVGVYSEGTIKGGAWPVSIASDVRFKGYQAVMVAAYATSAKTARNSLKLVHLPALLH